MPKDLAALLLDEGAVSPDALGRALDRQREQGLSLDTALLEDGAMDEATLLEWLSRAAELPPAPAGAWAGSDARARRVFPSRVAERHGLAPFALEGRELSLVATHPVDLGLLEEISFMLSLHLTAHVAPEWRVRELIHRLYGTPLAPRLAALARAAGARVEPSSPEPAEAPGAEPSPEAPRPPPLAGFARDDSEPLEPLAAALQQALEAFDPALFGEEGGEDLGDDAPEEAEEAPGAPPDRSAPPRWSLEDARAALAAARDRDAVVLTALRYARDFFEYAAVFAVTHDAVAGHDGLGAEDERERVRSVAIWATDPGIFRTVIETRSPFLGPVSPEAAGNEVILSGLGREKPRAALVYPVLLRDRPVCVVYADNGEAPVSVRRLGDLLLFLSSLGAAFERIIRARKKRRRRPPPAPPAATVAAPGEALSPGASPAPSVAAPAPAAPAAPPRAEAPVEAPPAADEVLDAIEVSVDDVLEEEPAAGFALLAAPPAPPASATEVAPRPAETLESLEERFFAGGDGRAAAGAAAPSREERSAPPGAAGAWDGARTARFAPPPEEPSLAGLAERALDADPAVAAAACAALAERRRDPALRSATERLRRALLSGIPSRAVPAARAIAAVRDVEAIPLLIQVLETGEPETADASAEALTAITLQRLGADARRWLGWWKQNRGRGRAEWLFAALTSADRETRIAASVELSLAAPPPVAYSADLPAAERERAARAWAGWWARSGHVL